LKKPENVEKLPKIYEGWNKTEREGNQKSLKLENNVIMWRNDQEESKKIARAPEETAT
jgi:hypothetical protein